MMPNAMPAWTQPQRTGFSVKSMAQLQSALAAGSNVVELKMEKFESKGTPLFTYDGLTFHMNHEVLEEVTSVCREHGCSVTFHDHLERSVNPLVNTGINVGFEDHHQAALKKHLVYVDILREYGIGETVTVHPPSISFNGIPFIDEATSLINATAFYEKLDRKRIELVQKGPIPKIGLENQTDPKTKAALLGYLTDHFKALLRNTRSISLTIDTGHRRLTKDFSVAKFIGLGVHVANFHFHGNSGEFDIDSYDDDQHLPPARGLVTGYNSYCRFFRRHRPTVILELSDFGDYSQKDLTGILARVRQDID